MVQAVGSFSLIGVSQFASPVFESAVAAGGEALEHARIANTVLVNNGMGQFICLLRAGMPGPSEHRSASI
jgi:hypothetical protein